MSLDLSGISLPSLYISEAISDMYGLLISDMYGVDRIKKKKSYSVLVIELLFRNSILVDNIGNYIPAEWIRVGPPWIHTYLPT